MLLFVRILSIYLIVSGILICQVISHVGCVIYLVPASLLERFASWRYQYRDKRHRGHSEKDWNSKYCH